MFLTQSLSLIRLRTTGALESSVIVGEGIFPIHTLVKFGFNPELLEEAPDDELLDDAPDDELLELDEDELLLDEPPDDELLELDEDELEVAWPIALLVLALEKLRISMKIDNIIRGASCFFILVLIH